MKGEHTEKLTPRELQILAAIADGRSNGEIGRDLHVSEDTVKTHVQRMFRKLDARARSHAVALGYQQQLLVGVNGTSYPAPRISDPVRLGATQAWLDEWLPVRREAPDHSRFANFYDGLAERLAARPDPPA